MFLKLDLFPSSGQGRVTPTLVYPLEKANLSHTQETGGELHTIYHRGTHPVHFTPEEKAPGSH
jgi:hypothetical protein